MIESETEKFKYLLYFCRMELAIKKYLFFFSFLFSTVFAQERLGISNSNYSSGNSIFLNPSSSVDSRTYMHVNIAGANVYAMNNLTYLSNFYAWSLIKNPEINSYVISDIALKKFIYACADLNGPSFVISKRNIGAGLFVRGRSIFDARNVPYRLTEALLARADATGPKEDAVNIKRSKLSSMTWVEYGANFGMVIKKNKDNYITFGANVRYLTGINFFQTYLKQLKGFYNDSVLNIDNFEGSVKYNSIGWNTGNGYAMDIGFTYKKMLEHIGSYYSHSTRSNCKYIDYQYKFGLTLRDAGYIRFVKNTNVAGISGGGYFRSDLNDVSYKSALETKLNTRFVSSPITAMLPALLVAQFDYNLGSDFYVNGTATKNLLLKDFTGVHGPDLISVCPRYETKLFEVGLPLTFQRYLYPQFGFTFRYRSFVLGFDNVLPLLFSVDTYGLNAYFSLGFSIYNNKACNVKSVSVDNCSRYRRSNPTKKKKFFRRLFRK
jgi:hypothetical protein